MKSDLIDKLVDGNYKTAMLAYLDIQKSFINSNLHFEKELLDWKEHVEYSLYLKKEILSIQGISENLRKKTENLLNLYGIAIV